MPNPGNPTVIVDDRSTLIKYTGDWAKDGIDLEFQKTTSNSKTQGNTAEFTFDGTKITVFGTYNVDPDSSWNFVIDKTITGSFKPPTTLPAGGSQNAIHHLALYTSPDLPVGRHTLVITQATTTPGSHIFLDYLLYTPSPDSTSKDLQYLVDDGNAAAKFENWGSGQDDRNIQHSFHESSGTGAKVTLQFEGTGVSIIGDVPRHVLANTMATISIDGGPVTEFKPNGQILSDFTVNQEIFKSAQLTQNNHTLVLTTVGDEPLRVDYFLVTPGEITRPTPTPTPSSSSTSPSSTSTRTSTVTQTSTGTAPAGPSNSAAPATNTSRSSTGNIAAIAGGTVAGIVGLALLFAIFMVWRRKRRENKMDLDGLDALSLTSERYAVQPFATGPPSGEAGYHNYPPTQSQYAPSGYNYPASSYGGSNHAGYGAGVAAGYGALPMGSPDPTYGQQPHGQPYGQDQSRSVASQPYTGSSQPYSVANPNDEERPPYTQGAYTGAVGDVKRRPGQSTSPPVAAATTSETNLASAYDGFEEPASLAYDRAASPTLPNPHGDPRPPGYSAS